ncbi:MAG: hypothetical protein QW051_00235 [Candidatus Aenigmatarchaeota archaeon]
MIITKVFEFFFTIVIMILFFYAFVFIHENAHATIFKNWGVRVKRQKITLQSATTIADQNDIKNLDKESYLDLQRAHANVEIINYIVLNTILLILFTIFIIKII